MPLLPRVAVFVRARAVQYGWSGCVWLYAVIACSGMLPSALISKPALTGGPAGPLAFQGAHGFSEFVESEGAWPGYRTGPAGGALDVMACGYGNRRRRQRGAAS